MVPTPPIIASEKSVSMPYWIVSRLLYLVEFAGCFGDALEFGTVHWIGICLCLIKEPCEDFYESDAHCETIIGFKDFFLLEGNLFLIIKFYSRRRFAVTSIELLIYC